MNVHEFFINIFINYFYKLFLFTYLTLIYYAYEKD